MESRDGASECGASHNWHIGFLLHVNMTYVRTHVKMPMRSARDCRVTAVTRVYRLITVASTTSWRIRPDEAAYGAAKAAAAQFARNIHPCGIFRCKIRVFMSAFPDDRGIARVVRDCGTPPKAGYLILTLSQALCYHTLVDAHANSRKALASLFLPRSARNAKGEAIMATKVKLVPPKDGKAITLRGKKMVVPDNPIIPFIEGDGTGVDIWPAAQRVLDAAVAKAYGGAKRIAWFEVYAGEKANRVYGQEIWLPDDTLKIFQKFRVAIKGPLTTPVGGGIRSINVALRQLLDLYVCLRPVRWF